MHGAPSPLQGCAVTGIARLASHAESTVLAEVISKSADALSCTSRGRRLSAQGTVAGSDLVLTLDAACALLQAVALGAARTVVESIVHAVLPAALDALARSDSTVHQCSIVLGMLPGLLERLCDENAAEAAVAIWAAARAMWMGGGEEGRWRTMMALCALHSTVLKEAVSEGELWGMLLVALADREELTARRALWIVRSRVEYLSLNLNSRNVHRRHSRQEGGQSAAAAAV